jgi:DNA-binding Lrp family transcriptional regulator
LLSIAPLIFFDITLLTKFISKSLQASLIMHLSEGCPLSLSALAQRCEVEEGEVKKKMSYWLARGVVREYKGHPPPSSSSATAFASATASVTTSSSSSLTKRGGGDQDSADSINSNSSSIGLSDGVYYAVVEEQAHLAAKDADEGGATSSSSSGGGGGGSGGMAMDDDDNIPVRKMLKMDINTPFVRLLCTIFAGAM